MSEQIVQLVRKESNLIDRLKDTKGVEDRAVQKLQKVISTSKIKIGERVVAEAVIGTKKRTIPKKMFVDS